MIPVADARARLLSLAMAVGDEEVALHAAHGRVLRQSVTARRTQPPFDAASMDGYALRRSDAVPGRTLPVVGEAAAGARFDTRVPPGAAVRIFTGAPLPCGADHLIIQEHVRAEANRITIDDANLSDSYIRAAGSDFALGDVFEAPRRLDPAALSLLAAMNVPAVRVARQPRVALIATGNELVMPGEEPGPDQIVASNVFGLAAMVEAFGGLPRLMPIARDTERSLTSVLTRARDCDLIVTIGGASVGDHDLVGRVLGNLGVNLAFYKVAMRPGKPLMAGRLGPVPVVGLPGNPVSALVCARLFLKPMIEAQLGLGPAPEVAQTRRLVTALGRNGPREHYMRAAANDHEVTAFDNQDSSHLTVLAASNCLIIRPPHAGPERAGAPVPVLFL